MPRVYPPLEGRRPTPTVSPTLIESVAGFSAGLVSTLVVHPFDVIKTRAQLLEDASRPGTTIRIIRGIAREALHGPGPEMNRIKRSIAGDTAAVVRAAYRGLMPNMIGNSVSWALYFVCYSNIKDLVHSARQTAATEAEDGGKQHAMKSSDYFLASGMSGVLTAVATNPIWVIKTRMLSTSKDAPGAYKSIAEGTKAVYKKEGMKGFYRGLVPSLFGVSHGAIQFSAYEQLKNHYAKSRKGGKEGLTNLDYLSLSAASKMFAGSITYPYQVVRARLQTYDAHLKYKGAWDVIKQIYAKEGMAGFYKGLGPNLLRVVPSCCVTFLVYENVKYYLPRLWASSEDEE